VSTCWFHVVLIIHGEDRVILRAVVRRYIRDMLPGESGRSSQAPQEKKHLYCLASDIQMSAGPTSEFPSSVTPHKYPVSVSLAALLSTESPSLRLRHVLTKQLSISRRQLRVGRVPLETT
jgi:hypothetical protein